MTLSLPLAPARRRLSLPGWIAAFLSAPTGVLSLLGIMALIATAALAPPLFGAAATKMRMDIGPTQPSLAHWLGTDDIGRDLLARTLVATGNSLGLAITAAAVAAMIGIPIGAAVGLARPRLRSFGSRIIDAVLGVPDILLAIFLIVILGRGGMNAAIAVGVANWPWFARLSLTLVSEIGSRDFVSAAVVLGVGRLRIAWRYVVPNLAEALVVAICIATSASLLSVSSLSFLGLGVQPPEYDWGSMLAAGILAIYIIPAAAFAPAAMIAVSGLVIGMFGDALARSLNPHLWTRGALGRRVPSANTRTPPAPSSIAEEARAAVLDIRDLSVAVRGRDGLARPVRSVSLRLDEGERVGLVGESGSGKTLTAMAAAGLLRPPLEVSAARFYFKGMDLRKVGARARDRHLGRHLAVVFQDPSATLNPVLPVGTQMIEGPLRNREVSRIEAVRTALANLSEVAIRAPQRVFGAYPHQLSGGMRQRVVIASGLGLEPALLIADEPTTALDVTVQAQVLATLKAACEAHGMALLLISHNIAVVSALCSRVLVMYGGRIVEEIPVEALLSGGARHPYTRALLAAVPDLDDPDVETSLTSIPGEPPDPRLPDSGCGFAPRCAFAGERCLAAIPEAVSVAAGHNVSCVRVAAGGS